MKDYYGNEIQVGKQVAFNLSGEVRLGVVTGFKPSRVYYMKTPYIIVQELGTKKDSKITRPTNLVVLT